MCVYVYLHASTMFDAAQTPTAHDAWGLEPDRWDLMISISVSQLCCASGIVQYSCNPSTD